MTAWKYALAALAMVATQPLVAQMEPVPGSQELFGQLAKAWVDTGAACPTPDSP